MVLRFYRAAACRRGAAAQRRGNGDDNGNDIISHQLSVISQRRPHHAAGTPLRRQRRRGVSPRDLPAAGRFNAAGSLAYEKHPLKTRAKTLNFYFKGCRRHDEAAGEDGTLIAPRFELGPTAVRIGVICDVVDAVELVAVRVVGVIIVYRPGPRKSRLEIDDLWAGWGCHNWFTDVTAPTLSQKRGTCYPDHGSCGMWGCGDVLDMRGFAGAASIRCGRGRSPGWALVVRS